MLEGQSFTVEIDADRFRGEFLRYCAEIEDHLSGALKRLIEIGEIKKEPHLFGHKFGLIRTTVAHAGLWMHSVHVAAILAELQPLMELRGELGHAIIGNATFEGEAGIYWRTPGNRCWADRKTLTQSEMHAMLEDLQRLTKKLLKQPLAAKG
jgi:hypothetical protein